MGRDFVQHEPVTVGRQRDDDRICAAHQICCAVSDRRIEHAFDGTLTAPTGWGLVHLAIHSSRLYYVAAFVPAGTDGPHPTYERVVQSLVPA